MQLPFTVEQFIDVFTRYNAAIGLAPLLAYAAAIAMLVIAARRPAWGDRFITVTLALMWAWTGIVYHALFFKPINPAAHLFAAAFLAQAALMVIAAFRGKLSFRLTIRGFRGRMAHLMVVFSMVVYPILGMASGHGYPNGPVFGLTPCPLVIFTFGMLLFTERTLPKHLVIVPLLWALIGSTAALGLGIREDIGLLVSGIVATTVLVTRRKVAKAAASPDPAPDLASEREPVAATH